MFTLPVKCSEDMPSKLLDGDLTTGSLLTLGVHLGDSLDISGWEWDKDLLTLNLKVLLVKPVNDDRDRLIYFDF